jgi:hypothetical protein
MADSALLFARESCDRHACLIVAIIQSEQSAQFIVSREDST